MKIWTRKGLHQEDNPQDLVAPWILSVEAEDEGRRGVRCCALDAGAGLLDSRFAVILLHVLGVWAEREVCSGRQGI